MNEVTQKTQRTAEYNPSTFNISSMVEAKEIILTPEDDLTSNDRWELEAPYLLDLISQNYGIHEDTLVLDYGCGVGRMAKALIDKYNCKVIGVDIIPNMRSLGSYYVSSDRYVTMHPNMLPIIKPEVDLALSIWVYQHCFDPKDDIAITKSVMKPGATLFVCNNFLRAVPTNQGFVHDGLNVQDMLKEEFEEKFIGRLDRKVVSNLISLATFYGIFEKSV